MMTVADITLNMTVDVKNEPISLRSIPRRQRLSSRTYLGLSCYDITVSLDPNSSAKIIGTSFPDSFGITNLPDYGTDRSSIKLQAVGFNRSIEAVMTNVTLATVELREAEDGTTNLSVEGMNRINDD